MTTPDNTATGPGQAGASGRSAADDGVEQAAAVTDRVPAVPDPSPGDADRATGTTDGGPALPSGPAVPSDSAPSPGEQVASAAAEPEAPAEIPPEQVTQRDAPSPQAPQRGAGSGGAPPDSRPPDAAPEQRRANGTTTSVNSAVPPWQRPGSSASEAETTAVGLQVAQPEHPRSGNQPKDDPRPAGTTRGHSPDFTPASQAVPRYGRPVAQPFNTQSNRGPNQNFSQPTVRIGGRVPPEQAAAQPSNARVRPTRIPRRASLQLRYLEPWSVLKVSLVLSVAGFLAWMVAVGVLYSILGGMGVWDQLNGTYSDLTSVNDPQASQDLISAGGVFGVAALVGMVNIVLITAMCTVGAFIYNASADLAGGIEVTLSERD